MINSPTHNEALFPDMSDAELVSALKQGDRQAADILFRRYLRRLTSIAMKICRNSADAKDVVQEAFIKILIHIRTLEDETKFRSWANTIVANGARNSLRGKKKYSDSYDESREVTEELNRRSADLDSPETIAIRKENVHRVATVVDNLPVSYRQTFIDSCIHEVSYLEIVAKDGIPMGTVKSRIARARTAIVLALAA